MFYGVWGVAPSGMRAAAPQLARHGRRACMPKGSARCRANKAYTALPMGKGFGVRDREFTLFLKKQTFLQVGISVQTRPRFL